MYKSKKKGVATKRLPMHKRYRIAGSAGGGSRGGLGCTFSAGALGAGLTETALENLAAARAWITLAHLIIALASGLTILFDGSFSQRSRLS